jgi:hypothetical protein
MTSECITHDATAGIYPALLTKVGQRGPQRAVVNRLSGAVRTLRTNHRVFI